MNGGRNSGDPGPVVRRAMMGVFLLSIVLRVLLAVVNREANDIHLNVIGYIQFEGTFVHAEDGWEGYQPKLYHAACAAIGKVFDLQSMDEAIVAFQMLNRTFEKETAQHGT